MAPLRSEETLPLRCNERSSVEHHEVVERFLGGGNYKSKRQGMVIQDEVVLATLRGMHDEPEAQLEGDDFVLGCAEALNFRHVRGHARLVKVSQTNTSAVAPGEA